MTEQRSGRRRKSSGREQIDRLSVLPDSVICHILSFLPTKFSVRTSLLAKRWRYLWSHVPALYFELENQEIINRFMLLHKVHSLTTFRLNYEEDCSAYQLVTWITFAIVRNVQKLDIFLPHFFDDSHCLPRCLFTCKSLVELKLDSCGVVPVSGVVCLPHLKKLHLLSLEYEADESLPHLLSGCPMVEELEIVIFQNMASCNISSPTIKRLILNFMSNVRADGRADRLEINTPALIYLLIHDYFSEHIKCGVLTSLIEADINLYNEEVHHFRPMLAFFDKLCNVTYLKLNLSNCIEIFNSALSAWTTRFRNLRKLELTGDCRFLTKFLQNADNLEILIFHKSCTETEGWRKPPRVPTCLLSRLRIMKVDDFIGKKHELEYIKYILRNARVLETMEIAYSRFLGSEEKINMLQEISLFERESRACKVAFLMKTLS